MTFFQAIFGLKRLKSGRGPACIRNRAERAILDRPSAEKGWGRQLKSPPPRLRQGDPTTSPPDDAFGLRPKPSQRFQLRSVLLRSATPSCTSSANLHHFVQKDGFGRLVSDTLAPSTLWARLRHSEKGRLRPPLNPPPDSNG